LRFSNSEVSDTLQLKRRLLLRVSDGRSIAHGSSSILILLKEDLGEDDVVGVLELDAKDDDAAVSFRLEVNGFSVSVGEFDDWLSLLCVNVSEDFVVRSSHHVSLQQSNFPRNFGSIRRRRSQIDLKSHVVSRLGLNQVAWIESLQDFLNSVLSFVRGEQAKKEKEERGMREANKTRAKKRKRRRKGREWGKKREEERKEKLTREERKKKQQKGRTAILQST
jgi:hypothetical protein